MDKYRPYPSIIAMFTSDSQHPPRSRHAVYLGDVYCFKISNTIDACQLIVHIKGAQKKCVVNQMKFM